MHTVRITTGTLFLLLAGIGLLIAAQTPLWNDEYYSLLSSVHNISYIQILKGGIGEGNNSPLFYTFLKIQCDVFSYHVPGEWLTGHWGGQHMDDWIFLRLQSVMVMAVALSALFYYFSRRYSMGTGFYALAVGLSSTVVWLHWAEARPYAWWFALSIFQMLLLFEELQTPGNRNNSRWLILTHFLLALTVTISAVQIIAAGCVLWLWRRRSWKFHLIAVLLPLGIILFYYFHAPKYAFFFADGPLALISVNFPKERLLLALIFLGVFIYYHRGRPQWMIEPRAGFLIFMGLMFVLFAVILAKLKLEDSGHQRGFQIPGRYFLSLAPLSIIGTTIFSVYLMQAGKSKIWRTSVVVLLAVFLFLRVHQVKSFLPTKATLHYLGYIDSY